MFRASPPIFDVPEYPPLRRVKPLPKRRRTASSSPTTLSQQLPIPPLDILGPDATAEEILSHTDALSARMASYYMPILGDFLAGAGIDPGGGMKAGSTVPDMGGIDFGAQFSALAGAVAGVGAGLASGLRDAGGEEDDEHGDGDYIDHLQQPGNTKKRKVPANALNSPRGGHDIAASVQGDDLQVDSGIGIPTRTESEQAESYSPPPISNLIGRKKGKLTAATLAGLQHKEMLKNRKRQLAAVLGALSLGDTLALDQALSANYPFPSGAGFEDLKSADPPKVRLSKRSVVRSARVARLNRLPTPHPDAVPLPSGEFTFVCHSATADRLVATKEEVAMLRKRFETELERQAEKAAKLAAANKASSQHPSGKGGGSRRSKRVQQRARTITSGKGAAGEQTAEFLDHAGGNNSVGNEGGNSGGGGSMNAGAAGAGAGAQTQSAAVMTPTNTNGAKSRGGGKKKKRSALANASNPHHLRNYVPSRLPHSGGGGGHGNVNGNGQNGKGDNWLSPLPLKFLSAEIPPRRKKNQSGTSSTTTTTMPLTNPVDEWICAYCEYELFYGDEAQYKRAIRNRKKILKRRRRARERAAAAASGNSALKTQEKAGGGGGEGEYEEGFDVPQDEFANVPKQSKWKGDPNKERERALAGEQGYG